ncbi:MAG: TolC family protein [Leeuwenhoekiella sp.]
MRTLFPILLFFFGILAGYSQADTLVLDFREYLAQVKRFHPVARQAQLTLNAGEATLLRARGGFDPKLEADFDKKNFKGDEYFDIFNATFKIPTYYGLEFKAQLEQNEGIFLNPQNNVPTDGLYSAGVSASLLQGLWINDRMATLRKARLFQNQTAAERDLLINQILFEASRAYFDWVMAFREYTVYSNFVLNAQIRFEGVKRSALAGDRPTIDTTEALITVNNRLLSLEQARVYLIKSKLEVSNYLWVGDNIPLELQDNVIPEVQLNQEIDKAFEIEGLPLTEYTVENHPKLRALDFKVQQLEVDRRLKGNKLLPKLDVSYNFLTATPQDANSLNTENYKASVKFALPLFLRKERGAFQLAKIKAQDARYDLSNAELQIRNKILAIYRELESFINQNLLIDQIVRDYQRLVSAEERKFSFGESSLFLVNSREKSLIDAQLKAISVQNKFFSAKAKLFNSLAKNPSNF